MKTILFAAAILGISTANAAVRPEQGSMHSCQWQAMAETYETGEVAVFSDETAMACPSWSRRGMVVAIATWRDHLSRACGNFIETPFVVGRGFVDRTRYVACRSRHDGSWVIVDPTDLPNRRR